MDLKTKLNNWDGKSTPFLKSLYTEYENQPDFTETLIGLLGSVAHFQESASWLLKHHLEQGNRLSSEFTRQVYGNLNQLGTWSARLHILQCLPYLKIEAEFKNKLEQFLRKTIRDENKFVRAWAYNGFYELAVAFQEYREEALGLLNAALQNEAASVQARVRQVLKKGF